MRTSGIITAAFAAAAVAVPLVDKREVDVVTDIDIVYVTDVVTKTVGAGYQAPSVVASSVATSAVAASSSKPAYHWGHWSHHHHHSSKKTSSAAAAPTSAAPPAPVTSSEAPAPTTTSVYVPPPSSSEAAPTSEAPAPTTEAPSSYAQPTTAKPSSSAPASSAAAPAAPAVTPYGGENGDANYKLAVTNHHNLHRANHSADAIEWDDNMASIAASIAATCVYAHNVTAGGGGYGQNIAAGVTPQAISEVITNMMYNGEVNNFNGLYGQANPTAGFEGWGHFSQIVWKNTKKVGCATQQCSSLANTASNVPGYFTVCNYSPPGNYAGEYADNIAESKNQPTVEGASASGNSY